MAALFLCLGMTGQVVADELRWIGPVAVASAPGGDRLELQDGRTVRLAGVRLPADEAVAARARAGLQALTAGRAVRLGLGAGETDRYGRLVAQVERSDGLWLQGALLEQGLAMVQTRPGETARAARMLERERAARADRRGLWAEAGAGPHDADAVHAHIGSFQVVRGRIRRVATTDRYVYLNFAGDWRTDFTVRLRRAELRASLARWSVEVEELAGRRVEVRGFVLEAGGPLIEVSHPEQLEILP